MADSNDFTWERDLDDGVLNRQSTWIVHRNLILSHGGAVWVRAGGRQHGLPRHCDAFACYPVIFFTVVVYYSQLPSSED
jgi:hypothetical protein